MIKDRLISLETSKLAKEKGLISGIYCNACYHSFDVGTFKATNELLKGNRVSVEGQFHLSLAPTQCSLQTWLREIHHIIVFVEVAKYMEEYQCRIFSYNNPMNQPRFTKIFNQYEEALERGLQIGLDFIGSNNYNN